MFSFFFFVWITASVWLGLTCCWPQRFRTYWSKTKIKPVLNTRRTTHTPTDTNTYSEIFWRFFGLTFAGGVLGSKYQQSFFQKKFKYRARLYQYLKTYISSWNWNILFKLDEKESLSTELFAIKSLIFESVYPELFR